MKGIGEPTTATLKKLALYFGVTVNYLRGGDEGPLERFVEGVKAQGITPEEFNRKMGNIGGKPGIDYWLETLTGGMALTPETVPEACSIFNINSFWVQTGAEPSILSGGGYVGEITTKASAPPWFGLQRTEIDIDQIIHTQIDRMMTQAREEEWGQKEIDRAVSSIRYFCKEAPLLVKSVNLSFQRSGALVLVFPSSDNETKD